MAFDHAAKWAAALLLVSATALAGEPSAADRESARAYMAEGRSRRDAGDLKSALRAFEAADAVMHVPTTALEVARTQAMMGQLVEARDLALQIARSQPRPGEPAPFEEARAAAKQLADDLEARIPSIRLVLKDGDGAQVHMDGVAIPAVAVGLGRKLDPGMHTIVVTRGSVERRMTVQVLEREAKEVPIDLSATASAPPAALQPTPITASAPSRGPWLALGIAGLGAGVAGIALGSITGLMSISETNDVKSQCSGNTCPATLKDGRDTNAALSDARTLAGVSTVAFIAGGVLAGAGAVFVVLGATHKARVEVSVGPASVGLSGSF
jgi:hypothetical protein